MKYNTALIVGYSNISKKHINLLRKKKIKCYLISKHAKKNYSYKLIKQKQAKKIVFDLIFLCCPASERMYYFYYFQNNARKFFLEKPLADRYLKIKKYKFSNKLKQKIYVGYVFRHNKLLIKLKKLMQKKTNGKLISSEVVSKSYLPDWRKHIDYKKSVSALKSKGGGVLLELSHEIDILYFLFDDFKIVKSNIYNSKTLGIDVEERVDIVAKLKNNSPVNLILNFNSQITKRNIIINFEYISYDLDLINNTIFEIKKNQLKKYFMKNQLKNMFANQINYFLNEKYFIGSFDDSVNVLKKVEILKK